VKPATKRRAANSGKSGEKRKINAKTAVKPRAAAAGIPPIGSWAGWYATQWLIQFLTAPIQPPNPPPPKIEAAPPQFLGFVGWTRQQAADYAGACMVIGQPA
jgi:hypothetical protein